MTDSDNPRRVLLKLSGEAFGGGKVGIDTQVIRRIAEEIVPAVQQGVQVAIVVGGGNFFRGAELQQAGIDRSRGDYMGMLGTVMNCLALQDFLEQEGQATRVQTAITMGQVAEPYIPLKAIRHLEKGRVVIFGAGAGMPYFSTDTVSIQRSLEIHCDEVLMGKNGVDGVYTADPRKVRNTRKLDEITFDEMLELASLGAQVLNNRSVELAKKYNVELEVLSSLNPIPGTVVKEVTKDMEGMLIKGVAKDTDVAVITILNVPDEPGTSFKIFGLLAQKNINVDIILQSTGRDGKKDISFTCAEGEAELAMRVLKESAHFNDVSVDTTCAKVSIVGAGMQSHSGVASKMFEAMSNNNINIKMISTSEIKISCIIDRADADKAVGAIHDMLFD